MRLFDKTVNVRLLAILLLIGAVLGGGIHWLHGFQARRQAGFFLDQADEAIEEGRVAEALAHLERYVRLRPNDVDALEKLGLLELKWGLVSRAYSRLEKTLRKDPDRTEVRRKLIDLAIQNLRFSDARQHISPQFFPRSYKDNELQDAELLVMLAACQAAPQEGDREIAEARDNLERAIEMEPDRLEAYQRLAILLRTKLDDPSGADQVMNDMVERNKSSAKSLVARAGYWSGLRQFEDAARDATEALESVPPEAFKSASQDSDSRWIPNALWIAAKSSHELGQLEAARTHAEQGIEVTPRPAAWYALLADIERQSARPQEAIDVMERGLAQNPNNPDLLWRLATIYVQLRDVDQAQDVVDELEKIDNLDNPIELLRGQIACLRGDWDEGRKKLEEARPKVLDKPDLAKWVEYLLGECYGQFRDRDNQLAAYEKAIGLDPKWVRPRLDKAGILSAAGRLDAAIAEYRELRPIEGRTRIELARLLIEKNRYVKPESRHWQEVEKVLDELPVEEQETVEALTFRAECLSQQGKFEAAEKLLADAETKMPKEVEIRRVRAALLQKQDKWPDVEELFAKAKRDLGNSAALQLGLAGLIVRQFDKKDAADRLRDLAAEAEGLSELEQVKLRRGLMVLSFGVGDLEQAERLYQLASEKAPRDALIQRLMFEVAVRKNDRDAIDGVLKMIADIPGQEAFWHYGEAVRQRLMAGEETEDDRARQKHLESALKNLAKVEALLRSKEDMARIHLLTGEIHDLEGRQAEALERYLAAAKLGPIPVDALQKAVYLLYQQGRIAEADQLMARIDNPQIDLKPELSPYLAEWLYRAAKDTRAIEVAEAVAADSGEYQDHLRLAEILRLSALRAKSEDESREMLDKAERSFSKAMELGRDSPAAWVPLIRFLLQTGKPEAAKTAFAEFQKNLPPEGAPYELAICYDMLARPEESRSELAKIIGGGAKFPPVQVNWARRKLASILLRQVNDATLKGAEDLLRENVASKAASVLDKRALATVLSVYVDPGKRLEAIGLLEELVETAADPQDRFLLAKLYLARGDWAEASRMFGLAAAESDRPEYTAAYVATYVEALLEHDQVSDAASWLRRLIELAPGEFFTVSLQIQVLCRLDQVDEAIALIEGIQKTAKPDGLLAVCTNVYHGGTVTPSQAERIEAVVEAALDKQTPTAITPFILADLRTAQERFDDAEALYRQVLGVDGKDFIALNNLAVLLALRKKNLDEAVRMIDGAIKLVRPSGTLLDSRVGTLLDSQATVYLAKGRASDALNSVREAIRENAKPSRYFHLAQVQDGLGKSREAKKAMDEARKLGLTSRMLHPLERAEYDRLSKMLDE